MLHLVAHTPTLFDRCSPMGVAAYFACALLTAASFAAHGSGMTRRCSADLTMGGRGWGWPVEGGPVLVFLSGTYDMVALGACIQRMNLTWSGVSIMQSCNVIVKICIHDDVSLFEYICVMRGVCANVMATR